MAIGTNIDGRSRSSAIRVADPEWELESAVDRRSTAAMVNACCYVVRNGCSWRMLPHEFPPWENVYRTFRRWAAGGKFEQMHDRLRELWRSREERAPEPSAAVLDAQSTRSFSAGRSERL